MMDTLTTTQRSELMAKVKAKGNRSTELRVLSVFQTSSITGWTQHPHDIQGRPDFYFEEHRVAVFVDGCFWHGCPQCGRIPKTREAFWRSKIEGNRLRDSRTGRLLRRRGYQVVRVWEHELKDKKWVRRLLRMLDKPTGKTVMNDIAGQS